MCKILKEKRCHDDSHEEWESFYIFDLKFFIEPQCSLL